MLHDRIYIGVYERRGRTNPDFCPAIIPQDLFDAVQQQLRRNVKSAPSGRVYLFTGLLVCAECGHRLTACHNKTNYYRCGNHTSRGRCTHNNTIREDAVEQWLLLHLEDELEKYRLEWEAASAVRREQQAAAKDRAAIRRKLARLKELYVNEIIDIEDYRRDYELYTAQLKEQSDDDPEPRPNFEAAQQLLSAGFLRTYSNLSPEGKRSLWCSVLRAIHVNNDREITRIAFA